MELLYFLGQDTSINIISSEYGQKLKSPAINVHIKTGGVTVQDVELFLTEDKDEYDDIIYLMIPTSYTESFLNSKLAKWLMWKNINNMFHILLCDINLYDKLMHRNGLKWFKKQSILEEIISCHSPLSRIFSNDVSIERVDCSESFIIPSAKIGDIKNFQFNLETMPQHLSKLYSGCIQISKEIPLINLKNFALDFMIFVDITLNIADYKVIYDNVYFFDGVTIVSKRPLPSIITSLKQLKDFKVELICKDFSNPPKHLINELQKFMIPFKCNLESSFYPSPFSIVLHESIQLQNILMLINTLKKCPSTNSFDFMLLHHNTFPIFNDLLSENFSYCSFTSNELEEILDMCKGYIFLRYNELSHKKIISPFVVPCIDYEVQANEEKTNTQYFIEELGDDDFGEQIVQYTSVAKNFSPLVDCLKEQWNLIKLRQAFQNIDYCTTDATHKQDFLITYKPSNFDLVFQSKIFTSTHNFLSMYRANGYSCVTIHVKRRRFGKSNTLPLSAEYYKQAISITKSKFKKCKFFILEHDNDIIFLYNLLDLMDVELIRENEVNELSLMAQSDGLILSNSSFAWYGATLNKTAKCIVCPKQWLNPEEYYYSIEKERSFSNHSWTEVDN